MSKQRRTSNANRIHKHLQGYIGADIKKMCGKIIKKYDEKLLNYMYIVK